MTRPRQLLFSLLCACSIPVTAAAQTATPVKTVTGLSAADETRLLKLGHTYVGWLVRGRADSLATAYDAEALTAMGGVDGLKALMTQLESHAGTEGDVLVEKMTLRKGLPQFWHEANFSTFVDEPIVIRLVLDEKSGKIVGTGMNPKSQAPAPDGY